MKKENTSVLCANKRKEYEDCRLEVISFDGKDVMTTSGDSNDDYGGIHDEWMKKEMHEFKFQIGGTGK